MYVESVTLTNFQCFGAQPTTVSLDPQLTALIGANGSGKTAVCQALLRLFGVTQEQRQIQVEDFHVPADEEESPQERTLAIEVILAFPELDVADKSTPSSMTASVPEFFRHMAATVDGQLKCRIALRATWTDDGLIEGTVEDERRVIYNFDEDYGDNWVPFRGADRNRIQMVYVPASRDGARQITTFLRGRLWRASRWSDDLRGHVTDAATDLLEKFESEPAVSTVEEALAKRWQQLHQDTTDTVPTFEPINRDVAALVGNAELMFRPSHTGRKRHARFLSDGQRSMLHLALTAATLDIESKVAEGGHEDRFDLSAGTLPTLTLLAVEEPENSLSPYYLSRVVRQLMELGDGHSAQAMLSSHSSGALARVAPDKVRHFRLDPSSGSTVVNSIRLPDNETEAGKYIREAVRAHPELYFARYVVLGEGDSEEIVIPLLAEAQGVPIDRSFVAMIPLGGRHTNHFWRLLDDLKIPHATLLDLDWGRNGGGEGRIKDVCVQLLEIGIDPFSGLDGYNSTADLVGLNNTAIEKWIDHLRTWNVFFSTPLDLDMSMLSAFWSSYTTNLDPGATGPRADPDPTDAVLGVGRPTDGEASTYWAATGGNELLRWYRYWFLNKSKPGTHMRMLTAMNKAQLLKPPPELAALISLIKRELQIS